MEHWLTKPIFYSTIRVVVAVVTVAHQLYRKVGIFYEYCHTEKARQGQMRDDTTRIGTGYAELSINQYQPTNKDY